MTAPHHNPPTAGRTPSRGQLRRAIAILAGALVLTMVCGWRVTGLKLRPELSELLPDNQPSVVELRKLLARTRGVSNVFVVLEGNDTATLRTMGDALVPRLRALGTPWVGSSESGVQEARAFLLPRAGLFASTDELVKLRDELNERQQQAYAALVGADLSDDEAPAPWNRERLRGLLGKHARHIERFPDGYYQSADGHALVVVARSAVLGDDLPRAREALARIKTVVNAVAAEPRFAGVRVGFAGDLVTALTEYGRILGDLLEVGTVGISAVLIIILIFYRRLTALVMLGTALVVGCACTFALTAIAIGTLNTATGFLFSIVAGNGINAGIILLSRVIELRGQGVPLGEALTEARASTWKPTLGAAVTAATAYAALGATGFRAFTQFAFTGGTGVLLCWAATYAVLPSLVVVFEAISPEREGPPRNWWERLSARTTNFQRPFVALVARAPAAVTMAGLALGLVGLVAGISYLRHDPLEYDLRHMENDRSDTGELYRLSALAGAIVGSNNEGGMVLAVDRFEQVAPLVSILRARRDAAPADQRPFEEVHSLLDFLPPEQTVKLPLLAEIRRKLMRARDRGAISDDEWTSIAPFVPPESLGPLTLADLPEAVRRPFTEVDGTVGRLVWIEPTAGKRDSDIRYLLRWADAYRTTTLPDGTVVQGSGRAVVYADLVGGVIANAPAALGFAFMATVLGVWLTFRRARDVLPVLGSLVLGIFWLGGAMSLFNLRVQFVNFMALPITLGIGVDYAVNIISRRDGPEPSAGALGSLRSAGGPVVLCSLTTSLGYLALCGSRNQGVRSLGSLAVLGEITCLLAAVLVLPAALAWRQRIVSRESAPGLGTPTPAGESTPGE